MNLLFYFFYNLLLTLVLPGVWIAAYFNEKLGSSFSGQKDIKLALAKFNEKVKLDPKPVVWLHAASAGEYEQIKPILARVREMDVYIFQTFTSATIYYKVSHDKQFDGVSFLPWDIYPRVSRFIKTLGPDIFINTRHDIWPNLLRALHQHKVRNILINANLYTDSKRLKPLLKSINRAVWKYIDHLYTGSSDLQALLENIYSGPIEVVGDSRFDQVNERARKNASSLISERLIADRRVIIYGSVVDSDLKVVSAAIAKAGTQRELLHIVVPHETHERDLIPWESEFYRYKLKSIRRSELDDYNDERIMIWNSVGQLADLYKYADLAYIGAGFTTGVHSVTEAAIYNVPSAHGPKFDILAEAIELVDMQLSTVVMDETSLASYINMDDKTVSELSEKIKLFTEARIGASDKIIDQEFPITKLV